MLTNKGFNTHFNSLEQIALDKFAVSLGNLGIVETGSYNEKLKEIGFLVQLPYIRLENIPSTMIYERVQWALYL